MKNIEEILTKEEILEYIIFRASGRGQSKEFTYEKFYNEILELYRKQKK